jgi:hypothetical protein
MEEQKTPIYKIIGITAFVFIIVLSVNYFGFDFQGTGYSVSQIREFEQEESESIVWPTSERPVNEDAWVYSISQTEFGNDLDIGSISDMRGKVILKFYKAPQPGSYILVERDGEKINMGFTIMQGRQMVTGIKSNSQGHYDVFYYTLLDNGVSGDGIISFDVSESHVAELEIEAEEVELETIVEPIVEIELPFQQEQELASEAPIQ